MEVLQKEAELQEIVQLVGSDALPESEQVTIEVARMIREIFLQQNAYDAVDTFCDMKKQYDMMKAIKTLRRNLPTLPRSPVSARRRSTV